MVTLKALVDYTSSLLSIDSFTDYCPNGLQVEGRGDVTRLVSGVTASMALIEAAIEMQADAIVVHHGYFWKGEDECVTGMKRARLRRLLGTDTSLLAYHLPLDAHPELGNNARLAQVLGFERQGNFGCDGGLSLGQYGVLPQALTAVALSELIHDSLGRMPLHIPGPQTRIQTVGWCTGAAQSYIDAAAEQGLDAFISGEISEQTVHVARERGIHYFAAGHHATERFGVQALGQHLAEQFDISHRFIDIDNPV
ncbi:MAG: Nif3-like dinuclear metal center hexameric protein [Pseudomonadota bacterium]